MRVSVGVRCWIAFCLSVFFLTAAKAAPGDKIELVRDLAARVGPIVGSALACADIARPRTQTIIEKFATVMRDASANEAQRSDLAQLFDRSVAEGRNQVALGRADCRTAERRLAELEQSLTSPAPAPAASAIAVAPAFAAPPPPPVSVANPVSPARVASDGEIRFGITGAFTGPVRERGRQ
ncbi:MAG: ABC transporter substrate-binding protein, partial [Hyphomicrobium sp.]